jgi:hypothetical protein
LPKNKTKKIEKQKVEKRNSEKLIEINILYFNKYFACLQQLFLAMARHGIYL